MCIVYKTDSDQSVSILHSKAKHSTDAYYPVWLCVCLCCFAVCSRNLTSRNVQWISWARAEAILKCKQCVLFIILSTQKPRTSSQLQARWTGINGNAHNLALIAFRMYKLQKLYMHANRHFRLHEFQWAPVRCLVFKTIFRTNLLFIRNELRCIRI